MTSHAGDLERAGCIGAPSGLVLAWLRALEGFSEGGTLMAVLEVRLFGKFSARCRDRVLEGLDSGKVQVLLCYILLFRDRPHHREILAELLWDNSATARSRKCLRQILWQLQSVLNSKTNGVKEPFLLVEPDWVQFDPQADLWFDVAVFEEAFAVVQGVPGHKLDAQQAQTLQGAVQLYHGDLLEGWYQDWCVGERERLQQMYLGMLDKLIDYCQAHQEYETGVACGVRGLRCDRARERSHRRLMRLYYLSGDRTAALRQYDRCVAALKQELNVAPAKRTAALYEQIRADQLADPVPD